MNLHELESVLTAALREAILASGNTGEQGYKVGIEYTRDAVMARLKAFKESELYKFTPLNVGSPATRDRVIAIQCALSDASVFLLMEGFPSIADDAKAHLKAVRLEYYMCARSAMENNGLPSDAAYAGFRNALAAATRDVLPYALKSIW